MYKLNYVEIFGKVTSVTRVADNAIIPFDPANGDYRQFKADVIDGAELQDADGNVMSQADAEAFIKELP